MASLFDKITKVKHVDGDVYRNIVSLRVSEDLFDDLLDEGDHEEHGTLVGYEIKHKEAMCPPTHKDRSFHYSTAVEYPFNTDNYMGTRYSDATFAAWYGSVELETTIYETLHWMIDDAQSIDAGGVLIRERAVYLVGVDLMAFDLSELGEEIPEILHPTDYSMTQMIGRRLSKEGARGLLCPSVRCPSHKTNLVVFDIDAIKPDPKLHCYLTYEVDFNKRKATVYRELDRSLLEVEF